MPNVKFKRKELVKAAKLYEIISDCVEGEQRIKQQGVKYLPMPTGENDAEALTKRYSAYLKRAVFYNVTKRTLDGLCGQIFMRDPVIEVPDSMNNIVNDADGSGVSLVQLAKKATRYNIAYGRAGLFMDYPSVSGPVTKAQLDSGDIRPTMSLYEPSKILNWRTISRGARELLSLVVLEETYVQSDDGFEIVEKLQWRVLKLVNSVYAVEIWREDTKTTGGFRPVQKINPTDSEGKPLTEIPFTFIGAENNDSEVDEPPMYDIAALNVAHYRNSADYEESAFMVGQPTPVFTGLTEDWVKNVLKGKVLLGSRGSVSLPVGGNAMLLQASPNSMPFEAMQHKEKQMVALGARIVEQRGVERTATEADNDNTTENSILASTAKNVSAAITWGLKWAAVFAGLGADEKIQFVLNTDFDIATMSPEDRRQLMEEWQSGALSWEEVRASLRKSGIATMDDTEARTKIDEELAAIPPAIKPARPVQ